MEPWSPRMLGIYSQLQPNIIKSSNIRTFFTIMNCHFYDSQLLCLSLVIKDYGGLDRAIPGALEHQITPIES